MTDGREGLDSVFLCDEERNKIDTLTQQLIKSIILVVTIWFQ